MNNGDGKPTVLLVDHDATVVCALLEALEFEGYRCLTTRTGAEAIRSIGESNLDAAVIDVDLPDMNGLALAHVIRVEQGPDVPVVMISEDASTDVLRRLNEAGASYFFHKPLPSRVLVDWLNDSLSRSPGAN